MTQFASQVGDRSKDAAGYDFAFDFGEPDLDLVEPGRIWWGEVGLHARMPLEEISHELGFMGGEVVENDMNLLPGAGTMTPPLREMRRSPGWCGELHFSVYASSLVVQRGIQRKCAVRRWPPHRPHGLRNSESRTVADDSQSSSAISVKSFSKLRGLSLSR
jgi:hypothetical protein